MPRINNPSWTRDELILALDLYFKISPSKISSTHPEIIKLSQVLNTLSSAMHKADPIKFRNPNGVYMKLCNFLSLDPDYHGIGLTKGGRLERDIWNEYANQRDYLHEIADRLRGSTGQIHPESDDEDSEFFPEGKVLYRQHRLRERNKEVIRKVKSNAAKSKQLYCQICGFDFYKQYGELGKGFIECHHLISVSDYKRETKVSIKDFALVCSNCHRMLHRKRPWLTLKELSALLQIDTQV